MKRNFVREYFDGKPVEGLKKAITPAWTEENLARHLELVAAPPEARRILEIGCGLGRLLLPLYDRGADHCVGVDASRAMVAAGRELLGDRNIELRLCAGDGSIDFAPDNYFDFAFSIIVFQHIPDPAAVRRYLAAAFRLLKPGGLLRFQVLARDLHPGKELWTFHDPAALQEHLRDLGFTEVRAAAAGEVWTVISARKPAVSVSISIMAHERRKQFIPYIFDRLGGKCPVAWDRRNNRWDTGRRAWELHDPGATHHLVLQDDVILSKDLPAAVQKVATARPAGPVSLFARNKTAWNELIKHCARHRQTVRWLVLNFINWGPALLLPVRDIAPMLAWVEENHCQMPNYDVRIGWYYLHRGLPCYYTMPSLVDHRTEGDSLAYPAMRTQAARFARFFIGEENSGADLAWNGQEVVESRPRERYLQWIDQVNRRWEKKNKGATHAD